MGKLIKLWWVENKMGSITQGLIGTKRKLNTKSELFTPVSWRTGKRLRMRILPTDIPRGHITRFTVVDAKTFKRYECQTKSCTLEGCICDAYIYNK